ncbi:MAG: hypothetical protein EP343_02340 [Deltaproteobacteria bacterium]|nr:MAG: hypothetical protein EP343_02340 [Deltaproteobacteria bacterium]
MEKVDLHRHLEGAIRPQTALDLGKQTGTFPQDMTLEQFAASTLVLSPMPLMDVLSRFDDMRRPIASYDAVQRISRETVEDAIAEGLTALNFRFSPMTLAPAAGVSVQDVFQAVHAGIDEALEKAPELCVERLAIVSRGRGVEKAWKLVHELEAGAAEGMDGVDFASDEIRYSTGTFHDVAQALDAMGLPLTVHTGEGVGPEAIRETLALPGLQRISHALSLVEDEDLVQEVLERDLLVEVSPSSNLYTTLVEHPSKHPARVMIERGIRVVICTDDPTLFGIDLAHEWDIAQTYLGMTESMLQRSQQWAKDALFASL